MPSGDLWAADRRLLRVLDDQLSEAKHRAGEHLHCRRGCFGCCIGPFPITLHDAERLRRGLAALPAKARMRIVERACEARGLMRGGFPGDPLTGLLEEPEKIFQPQWQTIPCPALNLESGSCELYRHRPIACRTYGPMIRLEGKDLPACPLNYRDVTEDERARMRVELDSGGAEKEIAAAPGGETVVAFAFKRNRKSPAPGKDRA